MVEEEFKFDDTTENMFNSTENNAPVEDEEEDKEIELPHTVKLSRSYTVGKRTFDKLVFKRPVSVGLIKHLPAGDMSNLRVGHFIPVIAGMTEMPSVVIEALLPKDFTACAGVAATFL